ncbi:hypothetical protein Hanom_Chr15g01344361 [Helianthus anomalus]
MCTNLMKDCTGRLYLYPLYVQNPGCQTFDQKPFCKYKPFQPARIQVASLHFRVHQ